VGNAAGKAAPGKGAGLKSKGGGAHGAGAQPSGVANTAGDGGAGREGELPYDVPQAAPVEWWNIGATFSGEDNAFLRRALVAGILAALACGFAGVFVVLKRIVFVGVALAEMSSAGIALALFAGLGGAWPLAGALLFTLAGVLLFAARLAPRRVPNESSIGVIYAIAGALAMLLISKAPGGELHMLKLLQGEVLTVSAEETWQMGVVYVLLGALHALFFKEFVLVSFDRDQASTLGFRAAWWDTLLFATIGGVIAFSIRAVGVLLTSTLLVMPAVTALILCRRLRSSLMLAPALAVAAVILGLHFSVVFDVPAAAMTAAISFIILALGGAGQALARRS